MARFGANYLLSKYNLTQSNRILINSKSYYHPYKSEYLSGFRLTLSNTITIGDVTLKIYRSEHYFGFVYKTADYDITFTRRPTPISMFSIYIDVYVDGRMIFNVNMDKYDYTSKFVLSSGSSEFNAIADTIVENTIAEICRNHLSIIINILQTNMKRYKR